MVESITAFKDASGKIHEDKFAAHHADLGIWFARHEAISETSAKQLAETLAKDIGERDELIAMLTDLRDNAPTPEAYEPFDGE